MPPRSTTSEQAAELWQQVEDDVLSSGVNLHDAVNAATTFRWAPDHLSEPRGREVFPDFWEHTLEDYTPRFVWCCYAIPWAIEQYDTALRACAEAPVEDWKARYEAEWAIVDRVWKALGITVCDPQGRDIAALVADLKRRAEAPATDTEEVKATRVDVERLSEGQDLPRSSQRDR
jgi:hypothetical protein